MAEKNSPNVLYARRYNTNKNNGKLYVHPKEYRGHIPKELRSMRLSPGDVVFLEEGGPALITIKVECIDLKDAGEYIPPIHSISKEHTNYVKQYKIVMPEDREKEDAPQMPDDKGASQNVTAPQNKHKPVIQTAMKKRETMQKGETINIPAEVIKKAKIDISDKLLFEVDESNRVIITKAPDSEERGAVKAKLVKPVGKVEDRSLFQKANKKGNQTKGVIPKNTEKRDTSQEAQEFKDRLRAKLAERKISQSELAQRVGMTGPSISQYVTGKRFPTMETLRKIAAILEVTPQWLAGNE